jgi:inorganic pyrophosphatase
MDVKKYLGKDISVTIDRPLGSTHPKYGFIYKVNYGYIPDVISPDGEDLDAYVLGVGKPLTKFSGECVAIIHRTDDDDDKLIVVPAGMEISNEEIERQTEFQEKWFVHELVR